MAAPQTKVLGSWWRLEPGLSGLLSEVSEVSDPEGLISALELEVLGSVLDGCREEFSLRYSAKSSQVKSVLSTQIQNSPPLVPGTGSLRRRHN